MYSKGWRSRLQRDPRASRSIMVAQTCDQSSLLQKVRSETHVPGELAGRGTSPEVGRVGQFLCGCSRETPRRRKAKL